MAESVPQCWLFPQVTVVAHHGGAGTIAAGLRINSSGGNWFVSGGGAELLPITWLSR
jgi:hypothetical protein